MKYADIQNRDKHHQTKNNLQIIQFHLFDFEVIWNAIYRFLFMCIRSDKKFAVRMHFIEHFDILKQTDANACGDVEIV